MANGPTDGTSTTAAQKAFNLPEVVLEITTHLPKEDLFVVQRINSTFYSTIADIPDYHTAMYTETLECDPTQHHRTDTFKSSALTKAIEPMHLWHDHTAPKHVLLRCEPTHKPYFSGPNASESWRRIRMDYGDRTVLVRSCLGANFVLKFDPRPSLGEIWDKFFDTRWEIRRGLRGSEVGRRCCEVCDVAYSDDDWDGEEDWRGGEVWGDGDDREEAYDDQYEFEESEFEGVQHYRYRG